MVRPVEIDTSRCNGCGICVKLCPTNVFEMQDGKAVAPRDDACIGCDLCAAECQPRAIVVHRLPMPATNTEVQLRWAGVEEKPAGPANPISPPFRAIAADPETPSPRETGAGLGYVPTPADLPRPPAGPARPLASAPVAALLPAAGPARPLQIEVLAVSEGPQPGSAGLTHKVLAAYPEICVGCQMCELACSLVHVGRLNPYEARIKVTKVEAEGKVFPVICHHCQIAKCEQACPTKALYFDPKLRDVVMLNEGKCVRCMECVYACPFGAIQVSPAGGILKCDLCGGEPACVKVCQERPEFRPEHWTGGRVSCLQYLEPDQVTLLRRRQTSPDGRT